MYIQLSAKRPRSFTISPTVRKSRYRKERAAWRAASGSCGSICATNSRMGMDETRCSARYSSNSPLALWEVTTQRLLVESKRQPTTLRPSSTAPPSLRTFSAHASHIIPGPCRGDRNVSIRVFTTCLRSLDWESDLGFRLAKSACLMVEPSDSPLILCAAQSAEISWQLFPHTFSV